MHEEALNYLLTNNRIKVVYGVLKYLHLSPQTENFEDLVMEGTLLFMQAYLKYRSLHENINEQQLMGYAFRKIKWGLRDLLRKQCKAADHLVTLPTPKTTDDPLTLFESQTDLGQDYEFAELLGEVLQLCNANERKYVVGRFFYGYSAAEIAQQAGVSRQTAYNWKKQVQRKCKQLFTN